MNCKWIVCRICLKNAKDKSKIFDAANDNLAEKIEKCAGIKLIRDANMPDEICVKCSMMLKISCKFQQLCQRSEQRLIELLQNFADANEAVLEEQQLGGNENQVSKSVYMEQQNSEEQDIDGDEMYLKEQEQTTLAETAEGNLTNCTSIELQSNNIEFLDIDKISMPDELSFTVSSVQFDYEESEDDEDETKSKVSIVAAPKRRRRRKGDDTSYGYNIVTEMINNTTCKTTVRKRSNVQNKQIVINECNKKDDDTVESSTAFMCYDCGNMYNEKSKLTLHMKRHTREKPHECEICHKRFAQTPQLARHMNSHTGNRPYKCKYCESSFADPSTCIKHERIHTNERPYGCNICGKAFAYSNVLKVHKMTHTGDKPFACAHCGKKFSQLHHKNSHERTHLPEVVVKCEEDTIDDL